MGKRNTFLRSLHDLGLGAWFGGSLMGAIGVNAASAEVDDAHQRARVANAAWARWTPINAGAIGAHLIGAAGLTWANKGRVAAQRGVAGATIAKGVLTAASLGATVYGRALGQRVMEAGDVPVAGGTEPTPATPAEAAQAQRQLNVIQWLIPAFTGGVLVMNAVMGEQQRPREVFGGIARRLSPTLALAGAGAATVPALGYSLRRRRKAAR